MTFTEPAFLLFILIVFPAWWLLRHTERAAIALLLTASLLFYGHNHWALLPLLVVYAIVNWAVGLGIERLRWPRLVLTAGVVFNLGVLAFFKYTPLLLGTLAAVVPLPITVPDAAAWPIPFGISFYAFTGIAYMVDVYRGTYPAEPSLPRYTLSAAFFPHLVAGPILRADEFLAKMRPGQMPTDPQAPLEAAWLIGRGFFKKLVLADRIAVAIDPFFAHVNDPTTAGVWALPYVYLYAWQIFFDFSAYTDIARGLGLLFGYRWPDNFNLPYLATSVAEFWHRWHMTLSRFLRDYLFIPLGGSRCGWWRTQLNLMLTMLLGGLWHGASWSFLVWGGLHGLFLVGHRVWLLMPLRDRLASLTGPAGWLWRGFCIVLTFHAVCLAWIFFRLSDFSAAATCVSQCVIFDANKALVGGAADASLLAALVGYGLIVLGVTAGWRWWESPTLAWQPRRRSFLGGFLAATGAMMLLLAVLLSPGGVAPAFIYFQF